MKTDSEAHGIIAIAGIIFKRGAYDDKKN